MITSISPDIIPIVLYNFELVFFISFASFIWFSNIFIVFTMHGRNIEDITRKTCISKLINEGYFENIVILSNRNGPGTIEDIHKFKNNKMEVCGW